MDRTLQEALSHLDAGRWTEAERLYLDLLQQSPNHADALHWLGVLYAQIARYDDAVRLFLQAIAQAPQRMESHLNLGVALRFLWRLDEALTACEHATRLAPDNPLVHHTRGLVLGQQQHYPQALAAFERVLELDPEHVEALIKRGTCRMFLGQYEAARESFERALEIDPGSVDAHVNLGCVLEKLGRPLQALQVYQRILHERPDEPMLRMNRAMLLLLQGRFEEGWREYEWRWRSPSFQAGHIDLAAPRWDGSPLEGRSLLLHAEQGFGDTLQFIRYLPRVARAGGRVILECPAPLWKLFSSFPGIDRWVRQGDSLPPFDLHTSLMSLPGIFRTTLDSVPWEGPYLAPPASIELPPELARDLSESTNDLRVGIVWAGSSDHTDDRERSVPIDQFRSLVAVPGTRWFSLQVGERGRDLEEASALGSVRDLAPWIHDFADTAALLQHLDLLISVDTAVVHLAGALGRPVWNLISHAPDWRWMLERDDSPWYPSLRLFRQPKTGDWTGAFRCVGQALAALIAAHGARRMNEETAV